MYRVIRSFLLEKPNIPLDKHPPSTMIEGTFVGVNFHFLNCKTPILQITFYQIADLFESTRVIPSLETDDIIPSGRLVALTCIGVTAGLLLLLISPV